MKEMLSNFTSQTAMYQVTLLILLMLMAECGFRLKELRWGIAGLVYITVGLWYFLDPIYRAKWYEPYQGSEMATVYVQVLIFLMVFRLAVEVAVPNTPSKILRAFDPRELDRGSFLQMLMIVWCVLFLIGMFRADFRFVEALFPVGRRWEGAQMWNRARLGGFVDFFVSIGFYSYLMCCAAFGLIAVGTRRSSLRFGMIAMICLSWPMFALSGSRSMFLAVSVPTILGVLILKRWSRLQQAVFLMVCLGSMNLLMLASIAYREQGLMQFFAAESYSEALKDAEHAGLNMPEELVYINRYQSAGQLEPELGYEYFAQAVNFVPRFIWPDKPFPGEHFAALRVGYFNGAVAATISNGLVGQGVQNFGKWVGPMAPAILLAIMANWMCKLPKRGIPFLRSCVVIFLLGLIPNLGRDLTLMTLWPAIFASAGVFLFERTNGGKAMRKGRAAAAECLIISPPSPQLNGLSRIAVRVDRQSPQ